jgi:hypothetical protein
MATLCLGFSFKARLVSSLLPRLHLFFTPHRCTIVNFIYREERSKRKEHELWATPSLPVQLLRRWEKLTIHASHGRSMTSQQCRREKICRSIVLLLSARGTGGKYHHFRTYKFGVILTLVMTCRTDDLLLYSLILLPGFSH